MILVWQVHWFEFQWARFGAYHLSFREANGNIVIAILSPERVRWPTCVLPSSRYRKNMGCQLSLEALFAPATEKHTFSQRKIVPATEKPCFFELSSDARVTPEGARASKSHGPGARYLIPATFPQLPRNSTWWGSSLGATWCHIPRDIQCHRVAYMAAKR